MSRLAALVIALCLVLPAAPAWAGGEEEIAKETYVYNPQGRRDPFLSIIAAAKKEREQKRPKGLVPLEDYDISQFSLVAIIWSKEAYRALVGLPDGKYYTVLEGASLGLHGGKVKRITQDSVIVREYIRDYKGHLRAEDTVLRLREEEGQ
jgi:type IV pilus assembly protein PilP